VQIQLLAAQIQPKISLEKPKHNFDKLQAIRSGLETLHNVTAVADLYYFPAG